MEESTAYDLRIAPATSARLFHSFAARVERWAASESLAMTSWIFRIVTAAALAGPCSALAQATVVSAPTEPSLLNLTREWSRESTLGDLRALQVRPGYLEVRVWGGFSLAETRVIVLRRDSGQWRAWLARVARCFIQIPLSVGDTASAATVRGYMAEARKKCGSSEADVPGRRIITADTLIVEQLDASGSVVDSAWQAAVAAGLFQLPGRVTRTGTTLDAFTYVVEVRRGDEYRASEIEHVDRAETAADTQVKRVYAALSGVLRADQIIKP